MRKKPRLTGLIVAVIILGFLALFTEKRFLLTPKFAATEDKLENGREVYLQNCADCHENSRDGAPAVGRKELWRPRVKKGMFTLVKNSLKGYEGESGYMPPKGGNPNLAYDDVEAAVAYMVWQSTE